MSSSTSWIDAVISAGSIRGPYTRSIAAGTKPPPPPGGVFIFPAQPHAQERRFQPERMEHPARAKTFNLKHSGATTAT